LGLTGVAAALAQVAPFEFYIKRTYRGRGNVSPER